MGTANGGGVPMAGSIMRRNESERDPEKEGGSVAISVALAESLRGVRQAGRRLQPQRTPCPPSPLPTGRG